MPMTTVADKVCEKCRGSGFVFRRIALPYRTLEQYVDDVNNGRPDPPCIKRVACGCGTKGE